MGENNNAGDEDQKIDKSESGADDQDESQNDGGADDKEAEGADTSEDENAEDGDEAGDDDKSDKDEKSKPKPTPNADEPKTRKRNEDFILERKNRKAEKLQKKEASADDEAGDDDEDLADDDAKIIDKRVLKVLSPFIKKQMQDEDKQEIDTFVSANPDFKPYVAKVQKFAQHPSRKDLPIESIFYEVAGKDLLKLGAERAKKADDEAKETNAGGGSNNGSETTPSVWDLTPEEFAAKQEEIRNKQRD